MNTIRKLILAVLLGSSALQQVTANEARRESDETGISIRQILSGPNAASPDVLAKWLSTPDPTCRNLIPELNQLISRWEYLQMVISTQITGLDCFDILETLQKNGIASDFTFQSFGLLFCHFSETTIRNLKRRLPSSAESRCLPLSPSQLEALREIIPIHCPEDQIPLFYRYTRAGLGLSHTEIGSQFDVYLEIVRRLMTMLPQPEITTTTPNDDIPDVDKLRNFLKIMGCSSPEHVRAFILNPQPKVVDLVPSLRALADGWKSLQAMIGNENIPGIKCLDILEIMWRNKIALGYTFQSFGLLFRVLSPDSLDNLERLLPQSTESELLTFSRAQHESLMKIIPASCPRNQIHLFLRYVGAAMSLQHQQIGSQFDAYLGIVRQLLANHQK